MVTDLLPRSSERGGARLRGLIVVGLTLLVTAALGPRMNVPTPTELPGASELGLPEDPGALEARLAAAEDSVPGVLPHATQKIVWLDPAEPARTHTVVVYVHGFSATRQETAPLSDTIAARLEANLFYVRLTGHGRSGRALAEATAADWVDDMAEALAVAERLGERVILIGTSTGGTLATWAASRPEWRERLEALVLLSPNFGVQAPGSWVFGLPWGGWVAGRLTGSERSWEPANELQGRYWTTSYPLRAVEPMLAWVRYMDRIPLDEVVTPTWLGYSPADEVVSSVATERVFERLGASRKEAVRYEGSGDPSNHILAGDVLAADATQEVASRIVAFVQSAGESR